MSTTAIQWKLSSAEKVTLNQTIALVAAAGTPVRLAASPGAYFRHATFVGKKGFRDLNAGFVWIGPTAAVGSQPYEVGGGLEFTISAPIGTKLDLYDFWMDAATNGDGTLILYF